MDDLVEVRARDCACPGTPHPDGDVVYMLPRLPLDAGLEAAFIWETNKSNARAVFREWLTVFVRYCAKGWNLTDDVDGVQVARPFNVTALLEDASFGLAVASWAGDRYTEAVTSPLGLSALPKSGIGQTGSSISPVPASIPSSRGSRSRNGSGGKRSAVASL